MSCPPIILEIAREELTRQIGIRHAASNRIEELESFIKNASAKTDPTAKNNEEIQLLMRNKPIANPHET